MKTIGKKQQSYPDGCRFVNKGKIKANFVGPCSLRGKSSFWEEVNVGGVREKGRNRILNKKIKRTGHRGWNVDTRVLWSLRDGNPSIPEQCKHRRKVVVKKRKGIRLRKSVGFRRKGGEVK